MTRVLIRIDADVGDEFMSAFPHLHKAERSHQATLTGDIEDQEELQGVLNHLTSLGVAVVDVVTIPD